MKRLRYPIEENINKTFNHLTIIGEKKGKRRNGQNERKAICKCDCGNVCELPFSDVVNGRRISCGHIEKKHHMSETLLYRVWRGMKARCSNPKTNSYKDYGARGITVCKEWLTFIPFMEWAATHGYRKGLTIERIDNNKGYSPDNCKWITIKEQCYNRRSNHRVTIDGETKTITEWCKAKGILYSTYRSRIRFGYDIITALTKPLQKRNGRKTNTYSALSVSD